MGSEKVFRADSGGVNAFAAIRRPRPEPPQFVAGGGTPIAPVRRALPVLLCIATACGGDGSRERPAETGAIETGRTDTAAPVARPDEREVSHDSGGGSLSDEGTDIVEAQRRLEDRLMGRPGVSGIGIADCDGTPCIKVFLSEAGDSILAEIPDSVSGHPVVVERAGPFGAQDSTSGGGT